MDQDELLRKQQAKNIELKKKLEHKAEDFINVLIDKVQTGEHL